MPQLTLRGLSKHFGPHAAVERLDLDIATGEFVSLLGPSGCGKTTTLRMIAGFVDPTEGEIAVDGRVLSSPAGSVPPERRAMSMIFQSYALWPHMTVADNTAFGLTLRDLPSDEIKTRVGEALEIVRMGGFAGRYPAELSGGQQQRVALARAIVVRPAVLLLDEPLSNLDASLREEMRFEIRRLHDALRITTVYVTHDQAEAMVTSDRIAVMNKGRIEQIDAPFAVYTRPRTRFVAGFIGRTNFLEGRIEGADAVFDGFRVARARLGDGSAPESGPVTVALRPHAVRFGRTPDAIPATIAERAFLGEHWDYVVALAGGKVRLRATALPAEVHAPGEAVSLAIDPADMVPITE